MARSPLWPRSVLPYATSLHYDLLHYHYDRWPFKTITGAINSAKQAQCSPAIALEAKTFSQQYWMNQHRYLMDAVRQFGFPSMFMTISPYEWTFPCPPWLDHLRDQTGRDTTELAIPETIHIAHVLEQYIRGYLCGMNTNRWKNHLFAKRSDPSVNNVSNYFYRFEFQKRGTLHAHILLWLDDMNEVDVSKLSATTPWANLEEAFLVYDLQKSRKSCLPLRQAPNRVLIQRTTSVIWHSTTHEWIKVAIYELLFLTSQASYNVPWTSSLRMEKLWFEVRHFICIQMSRCGEDSTALLHWSGRIPSRNVLFETLHPLEPEIVLQLTSTKIAWSNCRTKPFTALMPTQSDHKVHGKYLRCSPEDEDLTFLEWLRRYDHDKNPPKAYKDGSTLVGVKTFSVFNPLYFYQLLVMNFPHRTIDELHDQREEKLPEPIKHFVHAKEKLPQILGSRDTVL